MNAILGNKEAMGQIMALAQSLGKPAPPAPEPEEEPGEPGWERAGGPDPEDGAGEDPLSILGSLDPRMVQMGMRLLKEYRAIQIARLSRVLRVAFQSLSGKEEGEGV